MIDFIVQMLPLVKKQKDKTESLRIAKGKYKYPSDLKDALNTIKNR